MLPASVGQGKVMVAKAKIEPQRQNRDYVQLAWSLLSGGPCAQCREYSHWRQLSQGGGRALVCHVWAGGTGPSCFDQLNYNLLCGVCGLAVSFRKSGNRLCMSSIIAQLLSTADSTGMLGAPTSGFCALGTWTEAWIFTVSQFNSS